MRLPLAVSLITLVAIFIAVIVQTARLPSPSKTSRHAYTRLQKIARKPHPYNSVNNDEVRRYLKGIVDGVCSSALDESDNSTLWIGTGMNRKVRVATYFEQTNLVVYLPSSRQAEHSVLVSAHYDSVSSGNGATDAGMGVAVILALIEKYCLHSLPSNLIFNLNNAEEDGLFGAQAFVNHERFSEIKSFINLEGAGAGGPAMLFRTSGAEVAAAYRGSKLPRSSIAGNDFFAQGMIRSETDFVVYDPYIPGLDIAFFSPRSQYHTRRDTTKTASAWSIEHMLSSAETSMLHLTKIVPVTTPKKPVFFDFLGLFFYSTTLKTMLFFDLAILIASPVILGASFGIRSFFGKIKFVGLGRTLLALLLQTALVVGLSVLIAGLNPYIIHSSPLLYSATILLASFTANLLSTRLLTYRIRDQHDLSRVMSWELCIIWYVLLFASAITSLVRGLGSTYIVTLNFLAALVVALVSLFERSAYIPPVANFQSIRDEDQESTESSPLLRRDPLAPEIEDSIAREKRARDYRSATTWIIKFLILIPIPAIVSLWLLYSTVLPALTQTLPDGSNATSVYAIVGFFAVLTFFNLAPFFLSTSLSSAFPALLLLLIVLSITSALKAPFDVKAPLKLYYKQVVDFDNGTSVAHIEGLPKYMESAVSTLSLAQHERNCTRGGSIPKLNTCSFAVPVDHRLTKSGISTSIKSFDKSSDRLLKIDTINSRICDLVLESNVTVRSINGKTIDARERHMRLYRRDWDAPFELVLTKDSKRVPGRITCLWDDRSDDKIAAFDTIQAELPEWAELTKRETGLLQFSRSIVL